MSILYIDDCEDDLFIASQKGARTAQNISEALEILKSEDIEAVVCDIHQINVTGFELVNLLRNSYPDKKYYLISGLVKNDLVSNIDSMDGFFEKPFNIEEIQAQLSGG
jgi:CheY-like chemotaxis protein